jgi:hypothetical protein
VAYSRSLASCAAMFSYDRLEHRDPPLQAHAADSVRACFSLCGGLFHTAVSSVTVHHRRRRPGLPAQRRSARSAVPKGIHLVRESAGKSMWRGSSSDNILIGRCGASCAAYKIFAPPHGPGGCHGPGTEARDIGRTIAEQAHFPHASQKPAHHTGQDIRRESRQYVAFLRTEGR